MTEPTVIEPLVSPGETERRNVAVTDIEWRTEGDAMHFTGYASVFDSRSVDLGGFTEEIKHGAFRKVLASGPEVRFLFNHDPNLVLANTRSGTMELREDPTGLRVEADLAPTTWGKDLQVLIGRGDVNKMSFGFRVGSGNDSWSEQRDGTVLRQIKNFDALMDVGPVTYPAYGDTSAAMRSLSELRSLAEKVRVGEVRREDVDFEQVARDVAAVEVESPWMAEQALRAFTAEDPEPVVPDVSTFRAAARRRQLALIAPVEKRAAASPPVGLPDLQKAAKKIDVLADDIDAALAKVGVGDPEDNPQSGTFTAQDFTDALKATQTAVEAIEDVLEGAGFPDPDGD